MFVGVESEPPEGHFCVTLWADHRATLNQRQRIRLHFLKDFSHFPDPSCGFAGDSGDPALFWITRSYPSSLPSLWLADGGHPARGEGYSTGGL